MDVSLPSGLVERIDEWVRVGSYGSRADVIAEAILLLAHHPSRFRGSGHRDVS